MVKPDRLTNRGRTPRLKRLLSTLSIATCLLGVAPTLLADIPVGGNHLLSTSPEAYAKFIRSGGPGKDGIPSIDRPRFSDAESVEQFLQPHDIVFGVYHQGQARAYPQRILVWHEIVNDQLGDDPLSITYCPLTATALAFKRGTSEFGVSGQLLNSNVVMYDRASDSLWSQITGVAIRGRAQGQTLAEVRVIWTTWGQWKQRYPQTQVLTRETGAMRNYNRDPYGRYTPLQGYYAEPGVMFPVMHQDSRYAAKQTILGFRSEHVAVAVDRDYLRQHRVLHYRHADDYFIVIQDPGLDSAWVLRAKQPVNLDPDDLRFTQEGPQAPGLEGLEPVNAFEAMWFAWYAFYPQTVLLNGQQAQP